MWAECGQDQEASLIAQGSFRGWFVPPSHRRAFCSAAQVITAAWQTAPQMFRKAHRGDSNGQVRGPR